MTRRRSRKPAQQEPGAGDLCADADAAWELARALSPRPHVRLADVDDAGRALNRYSSQLPLTAPTPDRPYAVYLADSAGAYRLLGFDLDPHRGPVHEDLTDLRELLDRAGLDRHLVCTSGAGGGRHVWVALAEAAPAHLVDAVARVLATRLPSLDIGPLVNPVTGCLRPPGAPHRAAGHSEPLDGSLDALLAPRAGNAQLQALLALLGAAQTRRPAHERRTVGRDANDAPHLLGERLPLPAGSRTALHDPLPADADTSAVLWTVLVGAARARWRLTDLAPLLATAPGLEHVRTARTGPRRTPRRPCDAEHLLARQWDRAVAFAAATRPLTGGDPAFEARAAAAVTAVAAVQGRADASPGRWARDGGPSDRRVLDAACSQLLAAVRLDVELDIRRLGELCGVSRETARRALHRLTADGWLRLVEPAAGVRAARWGLVTPAAVPSTGDVTSGVSQADPRPEGAGSACAAWRHVLARRLTDLAHDVFTPTPGLGHHAARVYAQLTSHPQHRRELVTTLGYATTRLDRYLDRLADAGLARLVPGMAWRRRRADRDRLARDLGTDGVLDDRRRRHRIEREAWAWWLDELAWMHLPHATKRRRRDPAPGQGVLELAGLTARQRHGPHPRRPNGRADYAAARAALDPSERRKTSAA